MTPRHPANDTYPGHIAEGPMIPTSWAMVWKFLATYGLGGAIAVSLLYNMVAKQNGTIEHIAKELDHHVYETNYVLYQSCVNLAVLAGTSRDLCRVPAREGTR